MSLDINLTNVQAQAIVVSTNTTATNDSNYTVVANATFTDPSPVEGKGFKVFVRNGTAVIGGTSYTVGSQIVRIFHSGAWANYRLDATDKVTANTAITGATKTKITYDSKGLVTSGTDATTADIADSSNKRYVTDSQLVVIGNTSGTNTGNETASTIGAIVNGASSATPNDTDLVATVESSVVKKITWASIKSFLKSYFDALYIGHLQGVNYSAVTGTTTETLVGTLTSPSNWLESSDSLRLLVNATRSGTTLGIATIRVKVNSVNDFSTATTIATIATTNSAQNYFGLVRENMFISGGNLEGFAFTTSSLTDVGLLATTPGSVAVDVTQPLYFFVSIANASGTESNRIRVFKISR